MNPKATNADIARELGVSPSTVSRALHDHPGISELRKAEVRKVAEAMGLTVPAADSPSAAAGVSRIACVVPSISHPFFADFIERLEALCARDGCDLVLRSSGGSVAAELSIARSFAERPVDGAIFIPCSRDLGPLEECIASVKTVVATQQLDLCPSIGVSHEEGGRQVAEHYKELGRRSCLLIGPSEDSKLKGFRSYIDSQRLTNFRVASIEVDGWDERFVIDAHRAIMEAYDAASIRQFDCVFAKTDLAAVGAIHALNDLGVAVPDEIAVCGFDDTPLAREVFPGLTSVAQPMGQIVMFAFSMLKRMIAGESIRQNQGSYLLNPYLVVRESTVKHSASMPQGAAESPGQSGHRRGGPGRLSVS